MLMSKSPSEIKELLEYNMSFATPQDKHFTFDVFLMNNETFLKGRIIIVHPISLYLNKN